MVYFFIHAEGETRRRPLKGKPGSGPGRRETVASASPSQRETGGSGITRRRGETPGEGFPPPAGKPVGDGTRLSERGSFGIVERSTGPQISRSATSPATERAETDCSGLRADVETAPQTLRASVCSTPNGVGSPARQRTGESPERVEASVKAPSGLSRSWVRCVRSATRPGL